MRGLSFESSSFTGEGVVEQLLSLSGDAGGTLETVGLCPICTESHSRFTNSHGMGTASRPDPDGTLFCCFGLASIRGSYISKRLLCSCWGNTENFANFGPGINLFELVFEFFTKAIEQTIVFSYFFHELFRINFTFHLAIACTRVKGDRQLVVVVSCCLQCCTLGNHSLQSYVNQALIMRVLPIMDRDLPLHKFKLVSYFEIHSFVRPGKRTRH